ncbi:hypothetical protein [Brevundimonas phoenicis]|uniref:hypothetical protein n=1 Tax=Brevundimonas sp. 2P05AB TaxID=3132270 RepID=UPI0039A2518F
MAHPRRMNRMIVVLGAAVVVLGGFSVYALMQGAHFGPRQTTPAERALDQVREQMGPQAEVRHVEFGARPRRLRLCRIEGQPGGGGLCFAAQPHPDEQ